jgi:hypothetical protein
MTIKLGDRVYDPITTFKGTVTSRTEYLFGCVRVAVEGIEKDGKPAERYFDEQRLLVREDDKEYTKLRALWDANRKQFLQSDPGGPGDVPPARSVPPSREAAR